jgi:hypothetical protein
MFLIVSMLYPAVAFAADESAKDERLVAFTQALKRPDGSNIQECTKFSDPSKDEPKATCVKLEDVTLGTLSYAALSRPKQGMSMKETAERWRLSRKIYNAVVKISKPDATLIMQAITEANFPVEYSGQAFCMLDATFCEEEKK